MMKARQYDRRALSRGLRPKVFAIAESNHVNPDYLKLFGDLEPQAKRLLDNMRDAKEYGSILKMELSSFELATLRQAFETIRGAEYDNFFDSTRQNGLVNEFGPLLDVAELLGQQYEAVVTNPPYMGASGMNGLLSEFVKKNYPDSKSDLFAVFIERCGQLTNANCYQAMITQHAWMFLSSFEKLREKLQRVDTVNMAHLGPRAFDEINGEVVQTTSFVLRMNHVTEYTGIYCRLIEPTSEAGKMEMLLHGSSRYVAKQSNFTKVPGAPIAYWVSERMMTSFSHGIPVGKLGTARNGMKTGNNDNFVRVWWEAPGTSLFLTAKSAREAMQSKMKWFPYNKGGEYRKWYGNNDYVVNWQDGGIEVIGHAKSDGRHVQDYPDTMKFLPALTWSLVTSGRPSFRYKENHISDIGGMSVYTTRDNVLRMLGLLNSKVTVEILSILAPTINYQAGDIARVPVIDAPEITSEIAEQSIILSRCDWDSFETSWDFLRHPLVAVIPKNTTLFDDISNISMSECFTCWQQECEDRFQALKHNEEELNRIFIDIYGLQDELTPEVEDKDVTVRRADEQRDIKSLISYAVGCMFGRYNPGYNGLAFAGGEWDASKYTTFKPDEDNVLPITDEEYLGDDIVNRFCEFIKTVYGEKSLEANLDYIASVLGNKGSTSRDVIRNYFLNDFFKDHCQTYSVTGSGKRPIYWLFDSGKQNGFKALIYLHRYTPDTIGTVRVDYLHKLQRIYENEINRMQDMMDHSSNTREVAASSKRKEKLQKQLKECREYDEKLAHLALSRIELDLDDGVKVNYRKMQTAQDGKFYEVLADSKNIMAKEK